MEIRKVEKEAIPQLHFQTDDVLQESARKKEREIKLQQGAILGNTEKNKCRIIFHAAEGDGYVETTIWAVTDKYVCLKGGVTILIAAIIDVII